MARRTSKLRTLGDTCSWCGAPIKTAWKTNGEAIAVEVDPIDVIFTNQAMAAACPCKGWIRHDCKKKEKK